MEIERFFIFSLKKIFPNQLAKINDKAFFKKIRSIYQSLLKVSNVLINEIANFNL